MADRASESVEMQSMFGTPDRKGGVVDGMIQSEYPAHMMNAQIDTLNNEIQELSSDLSGGRIPGSDVFDAKEELQLLQNKFDQIVISKPNYSISEETFLTGELEKLNQDVGDTLYSRYDQMKGKGSIARPSQEADLNDKPCIPINPEVARICNINPNSIVNGRVSRNAADKVRKILCAYFGRDDASRERIRPENNASRNRPMVGYTNQAFANAHRRIFGDNKLCDTAKKVQEYEDSVTGDTPESIQTEIAKLQDKISNLKGNGEINTIRPEVETSNGREVKKGKSYICPEPECEFVGKITQKGAHVRMHNKQKAAAALVMAGTETP